MLFFSNMLGFGWVIYLMIQNSLKWEVCIFPMLSVLQITPPNMGITSDCLSIALRVSDGNEVHIAKYLYWV